MIKAIHPPYRRLKKLEKCKVEYKIPHIPEYIVSINILFWDFSLSAYILCNWIKTLFLIVNFCLTTILPPPLRNLKVNWPEKSSHPCFLSNHSISSAPLPQPTFCSHFLFHASSDTTSSFLLSSFQKIINPSHLLTVFTLFSSSGVYATT